MNVSIGEFIRNEFTVIVKIPFLPNAPSVVVSVRRKQQQTHYTFCTTREAKHRLTIVLCFFFVMFIDMVSSLLCTFNVIFEMCIKAYK